MTNFYAVGLRNSTAPVKIQKYLISDLLTDERRKDYVFYIISLHLFLEAQFLFPFLKFF